MVEKGVKVVSIQLPMTAVQKRGLCSSTSHNIEEYQASPSSKGSSDSYHKEKISQHIIRYCARSIVQYIPTHV